ncbi:MAG TPA: C45 family autoproteolytic acyltransferase/hydrolase, partial [Clostridia bacterium]|nr:C45 family autoproteolytic acyltransferase/hydrolase [Clostridia bacterium]
MTMKTSHYAVVFLATALLLPRLVSAQASDTNTPARLLAGALARLTSIIEPATNEPARTFTGSLKILKAEGLPKELVGREFRLAFQAPDLLQVSAAWDAQNFLIGRDQQEIWIHVPAKKFGLVGSPEVPLFSTAPERKDTTPLGPLKLPLSREQLLILPLLMDYESMPKESVSGTPCHVFAATPKPEAAKGLKLPTGTLKLWVRESNLLPLRLAYRDAEGTDLQVELLNPVLNTPWPASKWKLRGAEGQKLVTVPRAHLTRFLAVTLSSMGDRIPTLGPATGSRQLVAREGKGRLEMIDGTRVLFLKGTPEEMGRQHGVLMKKEIRNLVDRMLYAVGVGSSFDQGRWFFGEIESAQKRLTPFMDERYFREMDAMADASGLPREEVRLSNFFPELFHCSGFALFGKAAADGRVYHGRILDYLRGMGLEQNATVMVMQPDQGNAWVNISYAGFIGSVTAMNDKQVAMGEMGGRGEGHWDGKPMAQLVREVMEKA